MSTFFVSVEGNSDDRREDSDDNSCDKIEDHDAVQDFLKRAHLEYILAQVHD